MFKASASHHQGCPSAWSDLQKLIISAGELTKLSGCQKLRWLLCVMWEFYPVIPFKEKWWRMDGRVTEKEISPNKSVKAQRSVFISCMSHFTWHVNEGPRCSSDCSYCLFLLLTVLWTHLILINMLPARCNVSSFLPPLFFFLLCPGCIWSAGWVLWV